MQVVSGKKELISFNIIIETPPYFPIIQDLIFLNGILKVRSNSGRLSKTMIGIKSRSENQSNEK
jgi:hypothetical protein